MQIKRYNKIIERTIFDKNEIIKKKTHICIIIRDRCQNIVATSKIDSSFLGLISDYKWNITNLNYVVAKKKKKPILIHRLILGITEEKHKHLIVDHINHNPLDNRLCNLRICSQSQNLQNRKCVERIRKNSKKTWQVYFSVNGKFKSFGNFKDKNLAIERRNEIEKLLFKEFAPKR